MIATNKIEMDLNWYSRPKIEATQDDKYSRNVEISLVTDGTPWRIPDGAMAVINYVKADGTGGEYDTMPNGEAAWSASDNVLTVKLAPQVLTAPGAVLFSVKLFSGEAEISTFTITINVHRLPGFSVSSEEYINMRTWLVRELDNALTTAKESGEFDGPTGRGVSAVTGNDDGTWTIKYTDGTTETVSNAAYLAIVERNNQISVEIASKEQLVPEFANTIEECADTTKLYVLPDGFLYAYMKKDRSYINQLPISLDGTGGIYNSAGYKANTRWSVSSGTEGSADGIYLSGYIPVKPGDIVRIGNITMNQKSEKNQGCTIQFFAGIGVHALQAQHNAWSGDSTTVHSPVWDHASQLTQFTVPIDGTEYTYIRLQAEYMGTDSVVTVNEEIVENTAGYSWENTGHAFVPADYESRIVELGNL